MMPRYIYAHEPLLPGETITKNTICLFFDASDRATGSIAYLRSILYSNRIITGFITAKNRIIAANKLTIPRKELVSMIDSCILAQTLAPIFNTTIKNCFFFGDSTIAISQTRFAFFHNPEDLKLFVCNQTKKILDIIKTPINIYHVPSDENESDILTRGGTVDHILSSSNYFQGPHWLRKSQNKFPYQDYQQIDQLRGAQIEEKTKHSSSPQTILVNTVINNSKSKDTFSSDRDQHSENDTLLSIFQIKRSLWKSLYVSYWASLICQKLLQRTKTKTNQTQLNAVPEEAATDIIEEANDNPPPAVASSQPTTFYIPCVRRFANAITPEEYRAELNFWIL